MVIMCEEGVTVFWVILDDQFIKRAMVLPLFLSTPATTQPRLNPILGNSSILN
jgi:hypothetical protein